MSTSHNAIHQRIGAAAAHSLQRLLEDEAHLAWGEEGETG